MVQLEPQAECNSTKSVSAAKGGHIVMAQQFFELAPEFVGRFDVQVQAMDEDQGLRGKNTLIDIDVRMQEGSHALHADGKQGMSRPRIDERGQQRSVDSQLNVFRGQYRISREKG